MAEKMPLIISVKCRLPDKVGSGGWPIVECEAETQSGPMLLQLTSNAARQLEGFLKNPGPQMRPGSGTMKLPDPYSP